jgi:hypothetical protein
MKKRFLIIITILSVSLTGFTQEKIELSNASFHSFTRAKTLELLNDSAIRNEFLKNLDTVVHTYFGKQLSYPNNFNFKADKPDVINFAVSQFSLRKKELANYDKSTYFLSFDISEQALNMDMQLNEIDTSYINELLKKRNICIYQLNAKIIRSDESVVMEKRLFVLLARPDITYFIGFEHPLYNLSLSGFTKLLKTCLPILFDKENESDLIQVTALPSYVLDNFIQSEIEGKTNTITTISKNIVQFPTKMGLQSLRFQEPGFEPIMLKGKKITPISEALQTAIRAEKMKDYIFLWEEGRDVFANKNYKLVTIATAADDPAYTGSPLWINRKTGLPLEYLKGNFHSLIQDNDTIAHFSIQTQVSDSTKKVIFNQLVNIKDNSVYYISKNNLTTNHIYHYELKGNFKHTAFKILISGISGSPSIKEIYFNDHLVCIAQGVLYPEVLSIIDTDLPPAILNPLLWLSFSSLF